MQELTRKAKPCWKLLNQKSPDLRHLSLFLFFSADLANMPCPHGYLVKTTGRDFTANLTCRQRLVTKYHCPVARRWLKKQIITLQKTCCAPSQIFTWKYKSPLKIPIIRMNLTAAVAWNSHWPLLLGLLRFVFIKTKPLSHIPPLLSKKETDWLWNGPIGPIRLPNMHDKRHFWAKVRVVPPAHTHKHTLCVL